MYIRVVTFMALVTADFILTMSKKCHQFTLTEILVIEQKVNLLVAGSEFKEKRRFLTINRVQATLFL